MSLVRLLDTVRRECPPAVGAAVADALLARATVEERREVRDALLREVGLKHMSGTLYSRSKRLASLAESGGLDGVPPELAQQLVALGAPRSMRQVRRILRG